MTGRRLSTERRSSFEDKALRFEEKATEPQHSKGWLSPTRRQRSRTEGVFEEERSYNETRSKMENTPSSRVSSRSRAHVSKAPGLWVSFEIVLCPCRNLWSSGCRSLTASAPLVTSWRGFSQGRALRQAKAEAPKPPCLSSASPWWISVYTGHRQTMSRCRGLRRL